MYVRLSDTLDRFATEILVAGLSKSELQKKLETVTPEDIAEVMKILKNPSEKIMRTAGRSAGAAALLLVLTSLFGNLLANPGVKKDVAEELGKMKMKGEVTLPALDNFKRDLAPEGVGPGANEFAEINKLLADARESRTDLKTKTFPNPVIENVGNEKLTAMSDKELAALKAVAKVVNGLLKAKPDGFQKTVDALVKAYKIKRDVKLS